MRIVRLANFVMARSGGLRTALRCLGEGYRAAADAGGPGVVARDQGHPLAAAAIN